MHEILAGALSLARRHDLFLVIGFGIFLLFAAAAIWRLVRGVKQSNINQLLRPTMPKREEGREYEYTAYAADLLAEDRGPAVADGLTPPKPGRDVTNGIDFDLAVPQGGELVSGGQLALNALDTVARTKELFKSLWQQIAGKPLVTIENRCDEESWGVLKAKFKPQDVKLFYMKIEGKARFFTIKYMDKNKNKIASLQVNMKEVSPDPKNPTINVNGLNLTDEMLKFVRSQMHLPHALHDTWTIIPNYYIQYTFQLSELGNYLFYYTVNGSETYSRCERVELKHRKDYSIIVEQKSGEPPKLSNVKESDRPVA